MTTAEQIVAMLRAAPRGAEVSSRSMCDQLGVSRTAVWKHVEALRAAGYDIDACSRRGYRLVRAPDTPCAAEVLPLLTTRLIGRDCRYVSETGSTNRDAAALASNEGQSESVTVVAGRQTQGRGRLSRAWFSPPEQNLYFSMLLQPSIEPARAASLPLVTGLAVAEAVTDCAPEIVPQIKWPNDILIGGKKLCGILCEMQADMDRVRYLIAGAGVNVNLSSDMLPEDLQTRATSLRIETGRVFSRAEVLAAILNRFEPLYDQWRRDGFEPLIPLIAAYDVLYGKTVTLEAGGRVMTGRAEGVQSDGALRIATDDGTVPVYSGEAHILCRE